MRIGRTVAAVLSGLVVLVGAVALRPAPTPLPETAVGDQALAERVRAVVGEERPAVAVAVVTADGTRTATIGAQPTDRFEIGSISKGLTGLLLAQAIERGEVTEQTTVGELLPLEGAPVADVTLQQLATHTSGLPVQPLSLRQAGKNIWSTLSGANPYDNTLDQELAEVRGLELDARPGTYSNLGFELLGHALAAAADQPYPELLRERVLEPLGMSGTTVPTGPAELDGRDLVGQNANGRRMEPWVGEAMAPAGGVRSDVEDMARLAQALLTEQAPGVEATRPRVGFDEDRIGWAWITSTTDDGRTITWHNGGTGGFSSWLGVDREAGTAVVVLSATSASVDGAGLALLEQGV
ncbi:serine hydrolase domain-containing protein [Desertihabitans brevis]|uniref:serine hydrolase domain-containing protein n=1 Tax=Desertihabitans brevis TaxID=2268447 RepID=UPI0018F3DF1E|nr:serine hydrolase domain-containing protein [Desertihabitans brevis]